MKRTVRDARSIFQQAVRAVQAPKLLKTAWQDQLAHPLAHYQRVEVAGLGKMALAEGGVIEEQLEGELTEGQVVIPKGYADSLPAEIPAVERLTVREGGHPVPDAGSKQAAESLLEQAQKLVEDDLLLVLISGGGTALTFAPAGDVSLEEAQRTFQLLLEGGAGIEAMNVVRKHLARVGGGQLARAAAPADVLALAVSDVVGDALTVIASGPTVPDPSTFEDAAEVLRNHELWDEAPSSVRRRIERGRQGKVAETPKPGDAAFARCRTELLGTNRRALEAAAEAAGERGYTPRIVHEAMTGEAREEGQKMIRETLNTDTGSAVCLLWGGETTVTVRGDGKGGRNQEMALAAALELDGTDRRVSFLSGGTDGIDGPTDAAGAVVTPSTVSAARREGLDARRYLDDNNSYTFFRQAGGLVRSGPTHANVMDVQVALLEQV